MLVGNAIRLVVRRRCVVLVTRVRRVVVVTLRGAMGMSLNPCGRPRAIHGDRHCAPNGEQQGEQHEKPDTESLHRS